MMAHTKLYVVVVVVTVFMVTVTKATVENYTCDVNPYNNGCTIPLDLHIPFRNTFLPACRRHDICYKCGNHPMYAVRDPRENCDRTFYHNMKAICNRRSSFRRWTCKANARMYYVAVRALGLGRMKSRHRVPPFCPQPWVQHCL